MLSVLGSRRDCSKCVLRYTKRMSATKENGPREERKQKIDETSPFQMTARQPKSDTIEWDRAIITEIESKKRTKLLKKATRFTKTKLTVNQDEGNCELSHNFADGKQKVNVYKDYRMLIILDMFI